MASSITTRLGVTPHESVKAPVVVAATSNVTLSGEQTISSVAVVAGDRVFATAQTTGSEKGIYVVSTGTWTRAADWNKSDDLISGTLINDVNGTWWEVVYSGSYTIGSTVVTCNAIDFTTAANAAEISTVAGISADVTTVAGISADATTVAGISADVTTVAGNASHYPNITNNLTDIQNADTNAVAAAASAAAALVSENAAASITGSGSGDFDSVNVTIDVTTGKALDIFSTDGSSPAIEVDNNASGGDGILARVTSDGGSKAVYAQSTASTGSTEAVHGTVASTTGVAINGHASSLTGSTVGVRGRSDSASGIGVEGLAALSSGVTYGVRGQSFSASGFGGFFDGNSTGTGLKVADGATITGGLTVDGSEFRDTTATNHVRAGNTQVIDGSEQTITQFDLSTDVTASTFETVGPTGSGATNVWTAMDSLPSSARILIVRVSGVVAPTGTGTGSLFMYACKGDLSPAVDIDNRVWYLTSDHDAAITGTSGHIAEVMIPLHTDQTFKTTYTLGSATGSLVLYYKGFITD